MKENRKGLAIAITLVLLAVGLSGCTSEIEKDVEDDLGELNGSKLVIKDYEIIVSSTKIEKVYIDSITVLLKNDGVSSVRLGYIVLTSGESEIKSFLVFDRIEAGEEKSFSESTYGSLNRNIGTDTLNATLSILTTYSQEVIVKKNITISIPFIKVGDTIPEVGSSYNMSMTVLSYLVGDIAVTYSNSMDKYTTWSPLEGRKFIVITFGFQNNWIKPQSTPYLHEGEIATDKGYIYPAWAYYSEKGEYRDSTEDEINTYIGDSGGYVELLPGESGVVGCIVFEIPEEEKAIEVSIISVPYLIKSDWY